MEHGNEGVTVRSATSMQQTKPQRGRPKGSGIDDSARLRQIAAVMASDPRIRPTTAIKAIGITDPSAIRRLRDKLNAIGNDMAAAHAESARPITLFSDRPGSGPAAGYRSAATARLFDQIRQADPLSLPVQAIKHDADAAPSPERQELAMSTAHMMAMSLVNMCNIMQQQQALWNEVVKSPAVALALRQQLLLSEMLLDVIPPRHASFTATPANA